ncbi:MAG TPA: hypothetical protein VJ838_02890 [Gaiellaceae bacterium]|nr:hypothetical protein [Gaiellaceae bacterium]
MQTFGPYTSVLVVVSIGLLLVLSGLDKKQLTWKRPKPLPVRSRRRGR